MVFCNTVAIGSGIFQFTLAQVNVFVFTAFEYSYLAFTSLVINVEQFPGEGGGGTPLYGLYRYVPRNRVWFLEVLDP